MIVILMELQGYRRVGDYGPWKRFDFNGALAKWLRREIRNLFSFGGVGSNPASVDQIVCLSFFPIYDAGSSLLRIRRTFPQIGYS